MTQGKIEESKNFYVPSPKEEIKDFDQNSRSQWTGSPSNSFKSNIPKDENISEEHYSQNIEQSDQQESKSLLEEEKVREIVPQNHGKISYKQQESAFHKAPLIKNDDLQESQHHSDLEGSSLKIRKDEPENIHEQVQDSRSQESNDYEQSEESEQTSEEKIFKSSETSESFKGHSQEDFKDPREDSDSYSRNLEDTLREESVANKIGFDSIGIENGYEENFEPEYKDESSLIDKNQVEPQDKPQIVKSRLDKVLARDQFEGRDESAMPIFLRTSAPKPPSTPQVTLPPSQPLGQSPSQPSHQPSQPAASKPNPPNQPYPKSFLPEFLH